MCSNFGQMGGVGGFGGMPSNSPPPQTKQPGNWGLPQMGGLSSFFGGGQNSGQMPWWLSGGLGGIAANGLSNLFGGNNNQESAPPVPQGPPRMPSASPMLPELQQNAGALTSGYSGMGTQVAQPYTPPPNPSPASPPATSDPLQTAYAARGIAPPVDPARDAAYAARGITRAQGGSVTAATAGMGFAKGGLIASDVPGRTDRIPMNVRPNSFVIPADIVSGVGQGNTEAGARIFDHLFSVPERAKGGAVIPAAIVSGDRGNFAGAQMFDKAIASGPYGSKMPGKPTGKPPGMPMINTRMPRPHVPVIGPRAPKLRADGGEAGHVPIVAAGGEYVCEPETVEHIGGGDYDKGHEILDKMVVSLRKQIISHMRKLPPPVKD